MSILKYLELLQVRLGIILHHVLFDIVVSLLILFNLLFIHFGCLKVDFFELFIPGGPLKLLSLLHSALIVFDIVI